ncbi:hypothetical protein [Vibrio comitans]|uniref:Uncharacterized protein n=1 Tax=Vibrio comitans NBRC 102076 TaxID=1219078 RepID=A0A4Y3IIA8_9VIBR|nr:hypothetical protein [Vibrio comitans]GEA58905.1 hypothetical protein VCO01S_00980 [Vibrio comitans NBRC 102076]
MEQIFTSFGIVGSIVGLIYGVICLALPFLVWGIYRQSVETNKLLKQLAGQQPTKLVSQKHRNFFDPELG